MNSEVRHEECQRLSFPTKITHTHTHIFINTEPKTECRPVNELLTTRLQVSAAADWNATEELWMVSLLGDLIRFSRTVTDETGVEFHEIFVEEHGCPRT